MDDRQVIAKLTRRTRAVFLTHVLGFNATPAIGALTCVRSTSTRQSDRLARAAASAACAKATRRSLLSSSLCDAALASTS